VDPIRWSSDIGLTDADLVGGKGANLGELTRSGFPVPPGFVVMSAAYLDPVQASGARSRLAALLSETGVDARAVARAHQAAQAEIVGTDVW
jgi:pyruvate,water dikinase